MIAKDIKDLRATQVFEDEINSVRKKLSVAAGNVPVPGL
jgi:hypothetical protein